MLAYVYNADLFCRECGDKIKDELNKEGKAPASPDDEYSFDSGEYPKGPFSNGGGEADYPQHCGNRECQVFLKNPLTSDGYKYVKELINEPITTMEREQTIMEYLECYSFDLDSTEF